MRPYKVFEKFSLSYPVIGICLFFLFWVLFYGAAPGYFYRNLRVPWEDIGHLQDIYLSLFTKGILGIGILKGLIGQTEKYQRSCRGVNRANQGMNTAVVR